MCCDVNSIQFLWKDNLIQGLLRCQLNHSTGIIVIASVVGEPRYDIHIIGQDSRSIYPIVQQKIKKKKKKKSAGEKKKKLKCKKRKEKKNKGLGQFQ